MNYLLKAAIKIKKIQNPWKQKGFESRKISHEYFEYAKKSGAKMQLQNRPKL